MTETVFAQGNLCETPADLEVKRKLLEATSQQMESFVDKFLAKASPGSDYNDAQKDVAWAAKKLGFLIGHIRRAASIKHRHGQFSVVYNPDTMQITGVKP